MRRLYLLVSSLMAAIAFLIACVYWSAHAAYAKTPVFVEILEPHPSLPNLKVARLVNLPADSVVTAEDIRRVRSAASHHWLFPPRPEHILFDSATADRARVIYEPRWRRPFRYLELQKIHDSEKWITRGFSERRFTCVPPPATLRGKVTEWLAERKWLRERRKK